MKVLIACEFSGIVRDAFRERGHDAVSCDLLPTERPGPHIRGDALEVLNENWDLMIAHPPCTHLSVSGARHFEKKRKDGRQAEAIQFFLKFTQTKIPRWAIENPVGIMSRYFRKPDQIIQPWEFGDPFQKKTCLWLNGLPKLYHTHEKEFVDTRSQIDKGEFYTAPDGRKMALWYPNAKKGNKRSITFPGFAAAMADQWGISQNGNSATGGQS